MEYLKLCDSDYRFMTIVWDNAPVSSGSFVMSSLGGRSQRHIQLLRNWHRKGILSMKMQ